MLSCVDAMLLSFFRVQLGPFCHRDSTETNTCYTLYGLVEHHGSLNSGHCIPHTHTHTHTHIHTHTHTHTHTHPSRPPPHTHTHTHSHIETFRQRQRRRQKGGIVCREVYGIVCREV